MKLPADVFTAAPLTFSVLAVGVALLALRATARVAGVEVPRQWNRVVDVTIAGLVAVFGLLVVLRFVVLA